MNELFKLTALKVVELLRRREISPLDLIESAIKRIAETDDKINALPTLCVERAQQHAKRLMQKPLIEPPPWYLHGLPIAVKDLENVAGVRTTKGSLIYSDHIPEYSNYMVKILEQNGAIVLAKSNTPEFGAGGTTANRVFGTTRNPWNLRMTPGGSSGGSAAALSAGQIWLATGSDLAGSIRVPASFCSVVGLRPTPGRVASGPDATPFDPLRVVGPMGRTVADVALMLDAQVGYCARDLRSFKRPTELFINSLKSPLKAMKIAVSQDLSFAPVDREVKTIFLHAASFFSELGMELEESHPDLNEANEVFRIFRAIRFAANFSELTKTQKSKLSDNVVYNIEVGHSLTGEKIAWAEKTRGKLYHHMIDFFSDFDLLLCPTVITPPFDCKIPYLSQFGGKSFDTYFDWLMLTSVFVPFGCPAISIPSGFTKTGLPVGLQIIGPPKSEKLLLQAASVFEDAHDFSSKVPIDPIFHKVTRK